MNGHTDTHTLYTDVHFNGCIYRTMFKDHHKRAIKKLAELNKETRGKNNEKTLHPEIR